MFNLQDLYGHPLNPEYRAQQQKAHAYYEKIQQACSPEFFEEFWQVHMTMTELETDAAYRDGFQEGVLFVTRALLSQPGQIKL